MTKKKISKKKPKKIFELTWTYENFEEHPTFYTNRMFGGLAVYAHHKMMMLIAEDPGEKTYRGQNYDFDIWNGLLFPTEYEYQDSLQKDFPQLVQHPILKKWLYLPLSTENFEETAHDCALRIRSNDKRFGIFPKLSDPKKKKKVKSTKKKVAMKKKKA